MKLHLCDYASWRQGTARQVDTGIAPAVFRSPGQLDVTTLCELTESDHASVLGAEFIPVLADGRCTFEHMVHSPAQFPGKSRSLRLVEAEAESTATEWLRSSEPLVLVGGCANHYHWLIDYLPRLMLVEGLAPYDGCRIVIHDRPSDHQRQALALLDIDPQRWVHLAPTQAIQAPSLVVPTLMSHTTACHPVVPRMLRRAFPAATTGGPKRVYLSREDAGNRRLTNEDEAVALLQRHGFVKAVASALSFQQQVDLFAGAAVIVAVHGAGLTNMVFSAPGTQVIEVGLHDFRPSFMQVLARLCRIRHGFVNASTSSRTSQPYPSNPLMEDWRLDLADLQRALEALAPHTP